MSRKPVNFHMNTSTKRPLRHLLAALSLAGCALTIAPGLHAAGPSITLDDLVARVVSANADLKAAAFALEAARAATITAGALPNPRVEWQSGTFRPQPSGVSGTASTATLAQPLENPWLRQARRAAADAGVGVASQLRQTLYNNVSARVRILALEVLLREEESRAFAESLALLEQVRDRIRSRVEIGEAPRYDLIKADAEIITARQRVEQSAMLADQVKISLNRLAGGSLPDGWRLSFAPSTEAMEKHARGLADGQLKDNPELRALERNLARAEELLRQARASVVPSLDILVTGSREPGMHQNIVGLSVTLPLLDRRQGPIAEAQAERMRALASLDGRRQEIAQEWLIAQKGLDMAQARVRALSQGALREAEAAVRIAEAAWRFGERGILDVLDAQRVLRALRADLILARFEAQAALIEIERLEGRYIEKQG
jgi:cobalt-zinc-cadmium efflux system outer membrane protein